MFFFFFIYTFIIGETNTIKNNTQIQFLWRWQVFSFFIYICERRAILLCHGNIGL